MNEKEYSSFLSKIIPLGYYSYQIRISIVIVMTSFLPVPLSFALTVKIEFSSISKVTSIWGTPLGAGGIPVKSNLPKLWLSFTNARSPSKTEIPTFVY